jgi:hypothetical protein
MRKIPVACLLVAALLSCRQEPEQRIVLDDAHNALSPATAKGVPSYTVRARDVYELDASRFPLQPRANAPAYAKSANLVTVASPSGMYAFDWPANATRLVLSASNAKRMGTSPSFTAFKAGEKIIIMIGYSQPGSSPEKLSLIPFWVGQVDVAGE